MKIDCVFLDFGPLGTEFCKPLRRRLEVVDMTVETTIRGKKCVFLVPSTYCVGTLIYNVRHPQPLDVRTGRFQSASMKVLHYASDEMFLRAMVNAVSAPTSLMVLKRFFGFWKRTVMTYIMCKDGRVLELSQGESSGKTISFFGPKIADFLEKLGVPLDLDGRECLVITKSDLEKIKKGELR